MSSGLLVAAGLAGAAITYVALNPPEAPAANTNVAGTKAMIANLMWVAKYVYIIAAAILVCYMSYYLFNVAERPIAGLLVFMGGVLAALFYYVKWFWAPANKPDMPTGLCPDFLTPVSPDVLAKSGIKAPDGGSAKTIYCMDFVGVSRNGQLKISDPASVGTQVQDTTWHSMPINKDNLTSANGLTNLKMQIQSKGLTWVSLFPDL